jgi:hypothetical protein
MRCLVAILSGILLLTVSAIVAIWFFYVEEDARGIHEWDTTKASLQKAGESIDFNDLIPLDVPDEQNLGVIPLFQLERDDKGNHTLEAIALKKALANITPENSSLPKAGIWMKGEMAEMAPIEKYLSERYQQVLGNTKSDLGAMEKIDALCPALNDLRQANATKSLIRFRQDYTTQPSYSRPLGITVRLLSLIKIINLHAIAALHENRPDVALDDIKITLKLDDGVRHEPVLVSGLVAAGMMSIQLGSVWEGLNQHAWNDQQLAELQRQLQEVDYLSNYQLCLRGEAIGFFAQLNDYLRDHRRSAAQVLFAPVIGLITGSDDDQVDRPTKPSFVGSLICWLIPKGWFETTKARGVSLYYQAARELADPTTHRVDPERADRLKQKIQSLSRYDFTDLILRVSAQSVINSIEPFSEAQFRVDAACIACALERYRLAHGVYPGSLDALTPYTSQGLPHDPINGEAYHYRLLVDGSYLLYSVGWNQIDDGGKVAYQLGDDKVVDWDHGDWVWPCLKTK